MKLYCEQFYTYEQALKFLNYLPENRSLEAKIVATDYIQPITVFYRKDSPND